MLVKEMVKMGEMRLSKAHCMDPKIDAEALYCYLTDTDKVQLFLQANEPTNERLVEQYFDLISEREKRIPLQYITGTQDFMGMTFEVTPDVLIPRQDTELLVEEAAKIINGKNQRTKDRRRWRVLDLCCGSGAISVSIAKICPGARVTATDISKPAVEVAAKNAKRNRVKVKFLQGDLFEPAKKKKFDMITSNPPYIRTNMIPILQDEIKEHEPILALDGGKDGLDLYRKIITKAPNYLKEHGVLVLEIGHDQADEIVHLIKETGAFTKVYVEKDLAKNDRLIYTSTLY